MIVDNDGGELYIAVFLTTRICEISSHNDCHPIVDKPTPSPVERHQRLQVLFRVSRDCFQIAI